MSPTNEINQKMGPTATPKPSPKEEQALIRKQFDEMWPKLLEEISNDPEFNDMPMATEWLRIVLTKNVPFGKQNRALAGITLANHLATDEEKDDEYVKLSLIFGWCAEIVQAAALMADDMMDESETRRGRPCWYKEEGVGMTAVNDCFMLENLSYFLLYKYYGERDFFPALLKHSHEISMKTIMGQCLDTRYARNFNIDNCTLDIYKKIVMYKTSLYSFYSPTATALIVGKVTDQSVYDAVKLATVQMGYLFQVQDDYLDCFGDPEVTGKIGTDITDAKCTWLIVKALELATDSQREALEAAYGTKSPEDELTVKRIYRDLDLPQHYAKFEKETYTEVVRLINELPEKLPKEPFFGMLNAIYKRKQ